MNIFITGGTGSLAKNYIKELLKKDIPGKIIVYSRNEKNQWEMKQEFDDKRIRYFLGDINNTERLNLAMREANVVIHAAALKHIDICEYNPTEVIRTNIQGTYNVMMACIANNIKKAVFISTDKAVKPKGIYGKSKALGEDFWLRSNHYKKIFSVCRYGNIVNSSGALLQKLQQFKGGVFPITDEECTRFYVNGEIIYKSILEGLDNLGLFVPEMVGYKVKDMINIFGYKTKIIGLRKNEKLHEQAYYSFQSKGNMYSNDEIMDDLEQRLKEDGYL